ncbi:glutaminyl-peptide cyclotransferase [Stomatohabitans albus]|uniref:glutaminyl-peptide cyclotransferase n=1 Tax=Stomatohabitans albus TaxID=3110766 RepID=UPI00300D7805
MDLRVFVSALAISLGACAAAPQPGIHVRHERPHDAQSFSQGLEMHGDRLFESRGLVGESAITELNPADGTVKKRVNLPPDQFGEGLTIVDDEIVQLTWQHGIAHRWTLDLEPIGQYTYTGEGWGLCWDGKQFVMSDGSDQLTFRDRDFNETGHVNVRQDGQPLTQLNELECANGQVYANVWHQNTIVRIDPATGDVTNSYDLTAWIPQGLGQEQVLNGIAKQPNGAWLITGKQWPIMLDATIVEPDLDLSGLQGFQYWSPIRYS